MQTRSLQSKLQAIDKLLRRTENRVAALEHEKQFLNKMRAGSLTQKVKEQEDSQN